MLKVSVCAVLATGLILAAGQVCADPYMANPQGGARPPADHVVRDGSAPVPHGAIVVVSNPSFEINGGEGTADIDSWTIINVAGQGGKDQPIGNGQLSTEGWQAQSGTSSPVTGSGVNPPTDGSFAAMTDQQGPSTHILYQDIVIPAGGGTLSFDLFINNQNVDFVVPDPPTLDVDNEPNQQFRADLIDPSGDEFDVGAGVVQNLYQTVPGDDAVSGYERITRTVAGTGSPRTLRLRFAVANNLFFFNAGVDNLQLVGSAQDIPSTDRSWLIGLGLLLCVGGVFAAWRRSVI